MFAALDRFNRRHPCSHNDRLGRWVVRQVVAGGARDVLDVGCGTGNLVDRLRRHAQITGLEPDPDTAEVAARRFADDAAVAIHPVGFADREPGRHFDAVTIVAVLHHLPLEETLRGLRATLRPGGRLVVVGCYREAGVIDLLTGLVSLLANPVVGLLTHPSAAGSLPASVRAPRAEPDETVREIRVVARRELPGARVRRRLFWRYTLIYCSP